MIKTEMDIKLYYDIDELVGFTHGYYDEFVYEEILFVIKFALGTAEYEEIDQHIYDIVYELGIVEGKIEDLELVNLIKLEEEKALNVFPFINPTIKPITAINNNGTNFIKVVLT